MRIRCELRLGLYSRGDVGIAVKNLVAVAERGRLLLNILLGINQREGVRWN